jgi:hypothetical protein
MVFAIKTMSFKDLWMIDDIFKESSIRFDAIINTVDLRPPPQRV